MAVAPPQLQIPDDPPRATLTHFEVCVVFSWLSTRPSIGNGWEFNTCRYGFVWSSSDGRAAPIFQPLEQPLPSIRGRGLFAFFGRRCSINLIFLILGFFEFVKFLKFKNLDF